VNSFEGKEKIIPGEKEPPGTVKVQNAVRIRGLWLDTVGHNTIIGTELGEQCRDSREREVAPKDLKHSSFLQSV